MEVCEEMRKLRAYLDAHGVKWKDRSEEMDKRIWFCRTHFCYHSHFWSVINGTGTHGGIRIGTIENQGMLEIMLDGNFDVVEGFLTAKEVIGRIESLSEADDA